MEPKLLAARLLLACFACLSSAVLPAGYDVQLVFIPVGAGTSYTAQLEGRAFERPGAYSVKLSPGRHRIAGSFHGAGLSVGFATIDAGGVRSGSVQSRDGPAPKLTPCSVTYASSDTADTVHSFQLDFEVAAGTGTTCKGPVP